MQGTCNFSGPGNAQYDFKLEKLKVFAAANDKTRLSKPLRRQIADFVEMGWSEQDVLELMETMNKYSDQEKEEEKQERSLL